MKLLYECRVTHAVWVIWDVEGNGDIRFFISDPGRGQCQVKSGQILKFKNYFQKHAYPVQFDPRVEK